jgi:Lon protease-like protein
LSEGSSSYDNQGVLEIDKKKIEKNALAILPLKSAVVYPSLVMPLMVTEARYAKLIDDALMAGDPIVLVAQKDADIEFI